MTRYLNLVTSLGGIFGSAIAGCLQPLLKETGSSRYLNTTLERKEQYFDALRSYFSGLVDYAAGEAGA